MQESKGRSRGGRKHGEQEGSVRRVLARQKEKSVQRQERTGRLRRAAAAAPSRGQKADLPGEEIKVQARSVEGAKCAKGMRQQSSPGRWRKLPRSQQEVEIQVYSKAMGCKDIAKGKKKALKEQRKCWGGRMCEDVHKGPRRSR